MTHAELVKRAEQWLRSRCRCPVVLAEPSGAIEIPDALGWTCGYASDSYLVECKASRADFLADRKKQFRAGPLLDFAIGRFRYYMTPPGLVKPEELPLRWGLLEVHPKTVRTKVKATRWKFDTGGVNLGTRWEMAILLSELRKFQTIQNGIELAHTSRATKRIEATLQATSTHPSPHAGHL